MKFKQLIVFSALTGAAAAGPEGDRPTLGSIPEWLDLDGDGVISEAERQSWIESRREASKKMFHMWDEDEDGSVNEDEREAGIAALRGKVQEKRSELFLKIAGEEGELSLEEFASGHPMSRLPEVLVGRMFDHLDADDDGIVTEDEFLGSLGHRAGGRGRGNPGSKGKGDGDDSGDDGTGDDGTGDDGTGDDGTGDDGTGDDGTGDDGTGDDGTGDDSPTTGGE
jgi:Ca2+-binding EF-hand superfamily protein